MHFMRWSIYLFIDFENNRWFIIEKENQQISRNNGYVICMLKKNLVKHMHPHYCNKSQTNKQININT